MARISDSNMLVKLTVKFNSFRKLDKEVTQETLTAHQASDDAGRFNKLLIAKEHLKDLQTTAGELRTMHYEMTVPWIAKGVDVLPSKAYFEYTRRFGELKDKFLRQLDVFYKAYPNIIDTERQRLGTLFREEDYPDQASILERFDIDVAFLPMPDAKDWKIKLFDEDQERQLEEEVRLRKEAESRLDISDRAIAQLWERLYKVINHVYVKMSDPKSKVFESMIDNVVELADLLPLINVTNDPHLDQLAYEARMKLGRFDTKGLREDPAARKDAANEAQALLAKMAGFMPDVERNVA